MELDCIWGDASLPMFEVEEADPRYGDTEVRRLETRRGLEARVELGTRVLNPRK